MRSLVVVPLVLLFFGAARGGDETERRRPGRFEVHETCALCHDEAWRGTAMRDASGRNVAPVDLWASSAMAHASSDPLWRAVVRIEAAATPSKAPEIVALCMRCHAPMGRSPGRLEDLEDDGLAEDGVSCTVCHGILPEGLGTEASFSGGWAIGEDGRLFGPHADPFERPMRNHTGFVPTEGDHVLASAHCGTCHTLLTRALLPNGEEAEETLPEQTPYLEWRNSIYHAPGEGDRAAARSCRDCHVPTTDRDGKPIRTRIAHNPGGRDFPPTRARTPYGRHVFAGGNVLLPRLRSETTEPVETMLATAARLDLLRTAGGGRTLDLDIAIENRTGHKLPTAHPTRRMWLVVEVKDGDGEVVFASGRFDARSGSILGADGKPLPSERAGGPLVSHTQTVTKPDQVALYEARMEDPDGRPTWLLTRGARFEKDNRLLPKGWAAEHPDAARTRPIGVENDESFTPGRHVVRYRVPVTDWTRGPFTVRVALVHQALGARFAAELMARDGAPAAALRALLAQLDLGPVSIDTLEARIEVPE